MINLLELVERERKKGYTEANAISKICQDIVLVALGNSPFNRNITIKGGVDMRCKTKNVR